MKEDNFMGIEKLKIGSIPCSLHTRSLRFSAAKFLMTIICLMFSSLVSLVTGLFHIIKDVKFEKLEIELIIAHFVKKKFLAFFCFLLPYLPLDVIFL